MALTITIPGAVETTTGSTAPAVLTVGVGAPGVGVPSGGSTGQYLVKASATSYDTAWLTLPANYITSVTAPLAVTAGNLAVNLSAYLTSATAASTYQTLAGMSSYLTSATAASTYQTQAGMSSYLTSSTAATTYAVIAAGQPTSGTVGQVLTKNSGTNYDSSWATLIPGDRYLTSSTTSLTIANGAKTLTVGTGLSYSSQQDVVIAYDAANHMHAVVTSYNSSTGALVVDVQNKTGSGTYAVWTVNVGGTVPLQSVSWGEIIGTLGNQTDLATALNAKLETSTAASTYAPLAGAVFTGEVSTPASTTATAGFSILPGVAPTSPTNGEFWNTGSDLQVRLGGVTETLAKQSWVTSQGYLTSSALTPYAPLAGATFTGLVTTPAATTTTAGLNIPHGAAPTTPVNGDIWTTTAGVFARINAGTTQLMNLSSTQTVSGSITFSNATQTLGNSTAASTINVGTGATLTATTKAVNIGTAGVSGSTTNIIVGPVLGASTTSIGGTTAASTLNLGTGATLTATTKAVNIGTAGVSGSTTTIAVGSATSATTTTFEGTVTANGAALNLGMSTAAATYNLGTGATLTATTKAVNIGTSGVAGSTTNIAIGSTTGTSTTTLQGTTNGITAAVDTNSVALATTAYVVGQAGSATPLVDGTAAVGTSLRYARADHVHPTDTSRAPLASPTFTGTPSLPTGTIGVTQTAADSTTALATTAFVTTADNLKANLASPTFTGTPTLPTGTIATTQTAGNNTTAIATTAFVTAAVPAFGTSTDVNGPTSTTKATNFENVRQMLLSPGYQFFYLGAGSSGTASGGYYNSNGGRFKDFDTGLTTGAYGQFAFDTNSSSIGYAGFTRGDNLQVHNWAKPIWISGRCQIGLWSTAGGGGQAGVNYFRVGLGGKNAFGTGDISSSLRGVCMKVPGGSGAVILQVSDGGTLTSVTSSFTPTVRQAFDWTIYSNNGTVTLYINDSQVATTSAGPLATNSYGLYWEGVDNISTATTNLVAHSFGTKIYHGT